MSAKIGPISLENSMMFDNNKYESPEQFQLWVTQEQARQIQGLKCEVSETRAGNINILNSVNPWGIIPIDASEDLIDNIDLTHRFYGILSEAEITTDLGVKYATLDCQAYRICDLDDYLSMGFTTGYNDGTVLEDGYGTNESLFNNVVTLPIVPVVTNPNFYRASEEGNIPCYINPSRDADLRFKIGTDNFFKGSVKAFGLEGVVNLDGNLTRNLYGIRNVCVVGDSIDEGFWAGDTGADLTNLSFTGLLRKKYADNYGSVGKGFIHTRYHYDLDPEWTFDSNWSYGTWGIGQTAYYTQTNGATATIQFKGTGYDLIYYCSPSQGIFTYSIDGGTPVTVDANNEHYIYGIENITDLEMGEHTLTIVKSNDTKYACIVGGYETTTVTNLYPADVEKGTDISLGVTAFAANYSNLTSSTEWKKKGNRSLKVEITSPGTYRGPTPVASIPAIPGKSYAGKKTVYGNTGSLDVGIYFYDSNNNYISGNHDTITDGNEHTVEKTMVAPANSARVQFYAHTGATSQALTWYEDETYLVEGTSVPNDVGVRVHCCGVAGKKVGDLSTSASLEIINLLEPELTIIAFGANDYSAQTPLTDFKNNLQTLVDNAKNNGSDVLIVALGLRSSNSSWTIPQSSYFGVMEDVAIQNNIPCVNIADEWISYEYAKNILNYIYDKVHPNEEGHNNLYGHIINVMTPVGTQDPITGNIISSTQILNINTILDPRFTVITNGIIRINLTSNSIIFSYWDGSSYQFLNEFVYSAIKICKLRYISREKIELQINRSKWTMWAGKPFVMVENHIDMTYTHKSKYYHDGTVTDYTGSGQVITLQNKGNAYIYNTGDRYYLEIIRQNMENIQSDVIPASDRTGISFWDSTIATSDPNGGAFLYYEFWKQVEQHIEYNNSV